MKIAFERSMRNSLYAAPYQRNLKTLNFEREDFRIYSTNGKKFNFGIKHIMMINIVHDIFTNLWYGEINGGIVPRSIHHPVINENTVSGLTKENLDSNFEDLEIIKTKHQDTTITIPYNRIIDAYPFTNEILRGPKKMIEVLEQINHLEFNMSPLIRFTDKENTKFYRYIKYDTLDKKSSKLFSTDFNFEVDTRKRLKNVTFEFDFNYFYSNVMMRGVQGLNIDFVSDRFYSLDISEKSKLFYIFFLLAKQNCYEPISVTKIINRIRFSHNSRKHAEGVVISILDELKENKLINSYKALPGPVLYRRFVIDSKSCSV